MGNYEVIFENDKGTLQTVVVKSWSVVRAVELARRLFRNVNDLEVVCCKKTTFRG